MQAQARSLFGIAALFNFGIAAGLLFLRPLLFPLLRLDPVTGSNLVFVTLSALMVGVFGYAYLRLAGDAARYRAYIPLGILGKLLVVGAVGLCWLSGAVQWPLAALASADLVFATLFWSFLRRHPAP